MPRFYNRIIKEYHMIKNRFDNIKKYEYENNIIFVLNIQNYNVKIKLIINDLFKYPFKKPKVLINDKDYYYFISKIHTNDYNIINKNKNCIYCDSVLCIWKPIKKIIHIIDEIIKIIKIKKRLDDRKNAKYIEFKFNLPRIIHTYL